MDARLLELGDRDNAVLAGRNPRDDSVWVGIADFCVHGYA
jgi:hypothetical protein